MLIKESVWVCVQGLRQSTLSDLGQIVFHTALTAPTLIPIPVLDSVSNIAPLEF